MSTSGVEKGLVVSQALPAEEEESGRIGGVETEGKERVGDHHGFVVCRGKMEVKQMKTWNKRSKRSMW